MKQSLPTLRPERGAVLVVGLIVLMLITLMVAAAFKFSTYNLKSVGNMQAHNEAIAAANRAIEQLVASVKFDDAQTATIDFAVDIDNDSITDYKVDIAAPVCVKATRNSSTGETNSEISIDMSGEVKDQSAGATLVLFNVIFDIDATATGVKNGARVRVHQGISRPLSAAQCKLACPPATGPCT